MHHSLLFLISLWNFLFNTITCGCRSKVKPCKSLWSICNCFFYFSISFPHGTSKSDYTHRNGIGAFIISKQSAQTEYKQHAIGSYSIELWPSNSALLLLFWLVSFLMNILIKSQQIILSAWNLFPPVPSLFDFPYHVGLSHDFWPNNTWRELVAKGHRY